MWCFIGTYYTSRQWRFPKTKSQIIYQHWKNGVCSKQDQNNYRPSLPTASQRHLVRSHVSVGDADATEDGERLQEVLVVLRERQTIRLVHQLEE